MIEPLKDDCAARYSAFRRRWAKRWDGGRSLLRKSLLRQLRQRPDCADLWAAEDERRIAAACGRAFKENLGLPHARLVPDDALALLAAIDAEGVPGVLPDLEREFRFIFEPDVWDKVKTFGELVRYVHAHQGSATLAEIHSRQRIGWGCAAVLGLILVGAIGLSISEIGHAVAAARHLELGAREALGLIVSALALIFSALMAAALVVNWYTARKDLRAEREQLSNPPAARRPADE